MSAELHNPNQELKPPLADILLHIAYLSFPWFQQKSARPCPMANIILFYNLPARKKNVRLYHGANRNWSILIALIRFAEVKAVVVAVYQIKASVTDILLEIYSSVLCYYL